MGHNVYFVFCLLSLVIIGPFGTIHPIISLIAIIIAGIFFLVWYLKEMKEQEKEYKNHWQII